MFGINKNKLVIGVCITVFLIIGIALEFYGRNVSEECEAVDSVSIEICDNSSIAQRILGNDSYLEKILFYIVENKMQHGDTIDVYLMLGGFDLSEDIIIDHQTFTESGLKDKSGIEIAFDRTKLISKRDYYVLLEYSAESGKGGTISLAANTDYVGLYENGKSYSASLAYRADYFSYINRLRFIWRLAFIFGSLTMVLCVARKIRFAEAIGLVCAGIMLLTYFFAALDKLKWSFYVIMLLAGVALAILVWQTFVTPCDRLKSIWKQYVMPDVLCWGGVILIFLVIDTPKIVYAMDDLIHWARSVQNMYMFEALPLHDQSNSLMMAYPPACSLFQYLFLKLYGRASSSIMYFALHFLEVSFFVSCFVFKKVEKNNIMAMSTFICVCIGLPELFFPKYMTEVLYVDILVGILLGYTFVRLQKFYEDNTPRSLLIYILSVAILVLTKENGLIFLLAFCAAQICFVLYMIVKKKDYHKSLKVAIFTIGFMIATQLSWQVCLKLYVGKPLTEGGIQKAAVKADIGTDIVTGGDLVERSGLGIDQFMNFILGRDKPYKYDILGAHLTKLFLCGDYENNLVDMSFMVWLAVLCIAFWILYIVGKKEDKIYLKWLFLLCGTGFFVICAFQVLYTFTFGETDARTFGGEERYLGSYLIAMAILLTYFIYNSINKISNNKRNIIKISICVGIFIITNYFAGFREHIINDFKTWHRDETYDIMQWRTEKLRTYICEKDKVFFCTKDELNHDYVYNYMYFTYNLTPIKFNERSSVCPVVNQNESGQYVASIQQFKEMLQEYDYLYIYKNDDIFCEDYGELFDMIDPSDECVLYQVNADDHVMFQKIADLE